MRMTRSLLLTGTILPALILSVPSLARPFGEGGGARMELAQLDEPRGGGGGPRGGGPGGAERGGGGMERGGGGARGGAGGAERDGPPAARERPEPRQAPATREAPERPAAREKPEPRQAPPAARERPERDAPTAREKPERDAPAAREKPEPRQAPAAREKPEKPEPKQAPASREAPERPAPVREKPDAREKPEKPDRPDKPAQQREERTPPAQQRQQAPDRPAAPAQPQTAPPQATPPTPPAQRRAPDAPLPATPPVRPTEPQSPAQPRTQPPQQPVTPPAAGQPGAPGTPPAPNQRPGVPGRPFTPPGQSPQPNGVQPGQPGQPGQPPNQQPSQPGQLQPGQPQAPNQQPLQPGQQPGQPLNQFQPNPLQPGQPPNQVQPGRDGYDRRDDRRDGTDRRDDNDRRDSYDRRDDRRDAYERRDRFNTPGRPGYVPGGFRDDDDDVRDYERVRRDRREYDVDGRTYYREPGRIIVRDRDGYYIRHDENERFRDLDRRGYRSERRGGEVYSFIDRPGGEQIVTVVDDDGRLVRRYRRTRDGREVILINNSYGGPRRPIYEEVVDLPPPDISRYPRERYVVDYDRADARAVYGALSAPPVVALDRRYTLDQVRYSPQLRARMPSVDINTITFDSGAFQVTPEQARQLQNIADAINQTVKANPQEVFLIEGYTDAVGADIDNLSLSDRRAQSVATVLSQTFNVPPENLTTQGYGEQYLKVNTQEASRENRRVTVRRITPLLQQQAEGGELPPPPQ